jgi:hypothetical protein
MPVLQSSLFYLGSFSVLKSPYRLAHPEITRNNGIKGVALDVVESPEDAFEKPYLFF